MTRLFAAVLLAVLSIAPLASAQDLPKATQALLDAENLGGLRLGLAEKDVLKLLGKPAKQGKLVRQEADGTYVQTWTFPAKGLELTMTTGESKAGAKSIAAITAAAPCDLATKLGIRIGSAESATRKAYGAHADRDTPRERDSLVVGSIYGGMIFNFAGGKVSRIFIGAAAE